MHTHRSPTTRDGRASRLRRAALPFLFLAAVVITSTSTAHAQGVGFWNPAPPPPRGVGSPLLLTDGSVIASGYPTNKWYRLTPNASGSYISGTWSAIAPAFDSRLYYFSVVLRDGRVLVGGGEYGSGEDKVELYDPVANTWTAITSWTHGDIGDSSAVVLDDGRVLVLPRESAFGWIYDVSSDTWTQTGAKLNHDVNDEETVVHLPGGDILIADVWDPPAAQRFSPATNSWSSAGTIPVNLIDGKREIGPGLVLNDGRVWFIGATGNTAFYQPAGGGWTAGPTLPLGTNGVPLSCDDAPAALLPNGRVLFAADQGGFATDWHAPTALFEYDPVTNTFASVPLATPSEANSFAFVNNLVSLPNGQVLLVFAGAAYVYSPLGSPQDAWRPTVANVVDSGNGTFVVNGTQFNGLGEGASFGDDYQSASNYPLVRLIDGSFHVFFARTFGHSTDGVATGATPTSTQFSIPSVRNGSYLLQVIANGISSSQNVMLNLARPTTAPSFTSSPVVTAIAGRDFVYRATASGAPAPLFSLSAPPAGMTVDPSTGYVAWTPTSAGSVPITLVASNGVSPNATQPFTVNVKPNPGKLAISTSPGLVTEGNSGSSQATFTVTRTEGSAGAISVQAYLGSGSATNGTDFTSPVLRRLSWADGDSQPKTFSIPIFGDTTFEPTETVQFGLVNASPDVLIDTSLATLYIVNDDVGPAGLLSFSTLNSSVPEGNSGTTTVTVTVTRTLGSLGAVSVQAYLGSGTAENGSDFSAPILRTLHWADGDTQPKTFTFTVDGDIAVEPDETVAFGLTNAAGGALTGLDSTFITITNDD